MTLEDIGLARLSGSPSNPSCEGSVTPFYYQRSGSGVEDKELRLPRNAAAPSLT